MKGVGVLLIEVDVDAEPPSIDVVPDILGDCDDDEDADVEPEGNDDLDTAGENDEEVETAGDCVADGESDGILEFEMEDDTAGDCESVTVIEYIVEIVSVAVICADTLTEPEGEPLADGDFDTKADADIEFEEDKGGVPDEETLTEGEPDKGADCVTDLTDVTVSDAKLAVCDEVTNAEIDA